MKFRRFRAIFQNNGGKDVALCYSHFDERSALSKALAIEKELENSYGSTFYLKELREEEFVEG